MYIEICDLMDLEHFPQRKWGKKAWMLSKVAQCGLNVLPGFCISLKINEPFQIEQLRHCALLAEKYHALVKNTSENGLIVRSSGILEDSEQHLFPGIYKSIHKVDSFSALIRAIHECYVSLHSETSKNYITDLEIAEDASYFGILVQKEIEPEFSGVAFTKLPFSGYWSGKCMLVQAVPGSCSSLVQGKAEGNTYIMHDKKKTPKSENEIYYKCLERQQNVLTTLEDMALKLLYKEGRFLASFFNMELDIEWAYRNGKLYIFQIRPIRTAEAQELYNETREIMDSHILFPSTRKENGLKWNSMHFFINNQLFNRKTLLIDAHTSLKEIEKKIQKKEFDCEELTVRFSYKNQIGMPRAFTSGKEEAINFIRDNWTEECALIIYGSIFVLDSYEIYIDREKIILEHVPGVWESDSKLQADAIVIQKDSTDFWRVDKMREARFENFNGNVIKSVPPLSRELLIQERNELELYLKKLQVIKKTNIPLNLHYVRDAKRNIYFLNCRISKDISAFQVFGNKVHSIKDKKDFESWDGKTSLLLQPDLNRGEEILLRDFVPHLKNIHVPVFVDFGILSHPAIMLRELGINITPRFMCHDHFKIKN